MNTYIEECFESENICSWTNILCKILDAKYEKTDLNKVMNKKCQKLSEYQRNALLRLLQKV